MAEISSIYLNNTTYDIKDAYARNAISSLGTVVKFQGTKADEATIKALTAANKGDMYIALDDSSEWLCTETFSGGAQPSKWESLGPVSQNLGDLAYADSTTASYTPSGSVSITPTTTTVNSITAVGSLPSFTEGAFSQGTLPSFTRGAFSAGTLPSFEEGEFSPGSLPSFTEGTFSAGSLPSFTEGAFNAGTLPSWSASVTGEVLSFSFSAGTLPSKAADTWSAGSLPSKAADTFDAGSLPSKDDDSFDPGTLPTHAADSFNAGTLPSKAADTFNAGTLPTKGANQTVMTGASASFSGTAATIIGEPTE